MKTLLSPLYVVCDADVCAEAGWALVDFASACLEGGARLLQLRAKQATGCQYLAEATAIVRCAKPLGGRVIINDRADIARLAQADGVHVGQEDLRPTSVRALMGPGAIIGLSTHTPAQLDAALRQPVDYVAVGPVFETATKRTGYDLVGLEGVREAAARVSRHGLPLVAIGGITLEHAASVIEAGAQSVTVISDLLATRDPAARVSQYLKLLPGPVRR